MVGIITKPAHPKRELGDTERYCLTFFLSYNLHAMPPVSRFQKQKINTFDSFLEFANGGKEPGWPQEIILEMGNVCNLKCEMCPKVLMPHFQHQQPQFTDLGLLKPPFASVLPYALTVQLVGCGEPTLHPQFFSYLDYLSDFEVLIDFYTNGMQLDRQFCDSVVSRRVFSVTVSFSGSTPAQYENIYRGGKFDQVLKGMKLLGQAKQRYRSPFPLLIVNSISFQRHVDTLCDFIDLMADQGVQRIQLSNLVAFTDNPTIHDQIAVCRTWKESKILQKAKERAARAGICLDTSRFENAPVQSKTLVKSAREQFNLTRSNQTHARATKAQMDCLEPYIQFACSKDMETKPCCFMYHEVSFGNLNFQSVQELWQNPRWKGFRKRILTTPVPSFCETCVRIKNRITNHHVHEKYKDYSEWFEFNFGKPFYPAAKERIETLPDSEKIVEKRIALTMSTPSKRSSGEPNGFQKALSSFQETHPLERTPFPAQPALNN
ncbi:MAG: SPASM domain-containing protein [Deltaproteobacteria bacterium]|nr:SPASM domain-containing protein [Deltaproteobacteria bacterium]